MGPHSSEQGNNSYRLPKHCPTEGDRLQWGLTLPSKETLIDISRIGYGPLRTGLQWGLTLPSKETAATAVCTVVTSGFNGASLFRARKHCIRASGNYSERLQWGLTLPSKETRGQVCADKSIDHIQASMGPHSSEQGNVDLRVHLGRGPGASMGPQSSEQGNHKCVTDDYILLRASMGPSLFRARKPPCASLHKTMPKRSMGPHSSEQGNYKTAREAWTRELASMGPHSSEQGNAPLRASRKVLLPASMGPHSSEQGTFRCTREEFDWEMASMGPHSSEQGN